MSSESIGIVLGGAAIGLSLVGGASAWLRRPRIEVHESDWAGVGQFPWTFATVTVRNRPLVRGLRWLLRSSGEGCQVSLEYRREGEDELAIPPVQARWSRRPEPLREEIIGSVIKHVFEAARVPDTIEITLPPRELGEEVAAAVLLDDQTVWAWGAESYRYDWRHPKWQLHPAVYRLTVLVGASGITKRAAFRLDTRSPTPDTFRLEPLE